MTSHTRRALVAIVAVPLQGCTIFLTGGPDTFEDMGQRLDQVAPNDFTLIDQNRYGLRSGFAGSGQPVVENRYSADWQGGALCDRLRTLLEQHGGKVSSSGSGSCGYQTRISAGWRARLVNVWTYELQAYATDPSLIQKFTTAEECAEIRERDPWQSSPDYLFGPSEPCGVLPGQAFVSIYVQGDTGW